MLAAFTSQGALSGGRRMEKNYKRVGRPRFHWLFQTMAYAFRIYQKKNKKSKKEFDMDKKSNRKCLQRAAMERKFPFNKKLGRNAIKKRKKKHKTNENEHNQQKEKDRQKKGERSPPNKIGRNNMKNSSTT